MELKQYIDIVRRWLWLPVICAVIAGVTAFLISHSMTPTYEATTTLLATVDAPLANPSQNYDALLASQILAKTYGDLLNKQPVLDSVIANLKLDTDSQSLAKRIRITAGANTQVILLTAEDSDAQRAADIANEVARVFAVNVRGDQAERFAATKRGLEEQLQSAQADIDRTQAAVDAAKSPATADPLPSEKAAEQQQLEMRLAQYHNTYVDLLNSLSSLRLMDPGAFEGIRVVEPAYPNKIAVQPRILLNTLLAAFVAALIGVGAAFGIELFDNRVTSAEDVERLTGLSTLVSIENMRGLGSDPMLVMVTDRSSPLADAYRALRMNIKICSDERPIRTIAVTSCGPRVGATTIVANLAVAFAQAGKKVIAVDANLRNPALHSFFGCTNERGLTTIFSCQEAGLVGEYLVDTMIDNLKLLPSGPLHPHALDLIESADMASLIVNLGHEADLVLFDSPSLQVVADALALARECDATLFVVQAGSNETEALARGKRQLVEARAHLLGAVLNYAEMRSRIYNKGHGQLSRYRLRWWLNSLALPKTQDTTYGALILSRVKTMRDATLTATSSMRNETLPTVLKAFRTGVKRFLKAPSSSDPITHRITILQVVVGRILRAVLKISEPRDHTPTSSLEAQEAPANSGVLKDRD